MPGKGLMPVGRLMLLCNGVNERPFGLNFGTGSRYGSTTGTVGTRGTTNLSGGATGSISARKRSMPASCSGVCFGGGAGRVNALAHLESAFGEAPNSEPGCALKVLSLIHISEPTRLGMISYAVFCLKKKNT